MTQFAVCLEIGEAGECMAHVCDLPGCFARGHSREEAWAALPGAIRAHHAWLRAHGEALPDPEPITLEGTETLTGTVPFWRGSEAALFTPDRVPLTRDELETGLRRAGYARADVLALARDLPPEIFDWKADPDAMSVAEIVRHIGNAEEWYVSRIVDPGTLPPEWEHDDDWPVFEFLEMERRTAAERLRRLTDDELRGEVRQPKWTRHPDEPWTARKALRRLQEHEREHLAHIWQVLAAWRAELLARLATQHAWLLWILLDLDEETLVREPFASGWTAKDILAHVAAWDELTAGRIEAVLAGRAAELAGVDTDARNAALYAERKDWSLEQALAACVAARRAFLEGLARVSDDDLHRVRRFAWGDDTLRRFAENRARHDATHTAEIRAWREAAEPRRAAGPKALLLAALDAGREELLAWAALVPAAERGTLPASGTWTIQDVLGHVADWEARCLVIVQQMAAGQPPVEDGESYGDAYNLARVEARRGQAWAQVWQDFQSTREQLRALVAGLSQAELARPFSTRWNPADTAYGVVRVCIAHDREHAEGLR